MSSYCMPFLIINLGGEMMYILEQRLNAQKIDEKKAKRVLFDITKTMFGKDFVKELFKPQQIYSLANTKVVFDKLAHCSIMRLSKNSMDKLFDLMVMGFKYQLMSISNPKELIAVTFNHSDFFKKIVVNKCGEGKDETGFTYTLEEIKKLVKKMKYEEFVLLRDDLLKFFDKKDVKVGLFLSLKMQDPKNGKFFIPNNKKEDKNADYFIFETKNGEKPTRATTLGNNIYSGEFVPTITHETEIKKEEEKEEEKQTQHPEKRKNMYKEHFEGDAKELNSLASMLGIDDEKEKNENSFKLSLFQEENDDEGDAQLERRDTILVFKQQQKKKLIDFDLNEEQTEEKPSKETNMVDMFDSLNI